MIFQEFEFDSVAWEKKVFWSVADIFASYSYFMKTWQGEKNTFELAIIF